MSRIIGMLQMRQVGRSMYAEYQLNVYVVPSFQSARVEWRNWRLALLSSRREPSGTGRLAALSASHSAHMDTNYHTTL